MSLRSFLLNVARRLNVPIHQDLDKWREVVRDPEPLTHGLLNGILNLLDVTG